MSDETDRLRELATAATPGYWREGTQERYHLFVQFDEGLAGPGGERVLLRMNQHFPHEADAAYIAAANPATMLRLLDEIDRQRALRCNCDEESGHHSGDCVTQLPGIVQGQAEEIERLCADAVKLRKLLRRCESWLEFASISDELDDREDRRNLRILRRDVDAAFPVAAKDIAK